MKTIIMIIISILLITSCNIVPDDGYSTSYNVLKTNCDNFLDSVKSPNYTYSREDSNGEYINWSFYNFKNENVDIIVGSMGSGSGKVDFSYCLRNANIIYSTFNMLNLKGDSSLEQYIFNDNNSITQILDYNNNPVSCTDSCLMASNNRVSILYEQFIYPNLK